MERIFDQKLRQVQRRLDLNRFLAQFGELLLLVGAATLVCALVEKALGVAMFTPLRSMVVAGVVVAALVVRWGLTRPSRMEVALAIDERLALRERFSTTLALAAATDPFAAAARSEAIGKVAQVDARRSFPIALTTRWAQALVCCAAAGAVFYFMPTYDLLGYEAKARETVTEKLKVEQDRVEVKKVKTEVEAMISKVMPEAPAELAKLDAPPKDLKPAEIKRQAINKLGQVAEALKQAQGQKAEDLKSFNDLMRQVKTPANGAASELARALQQGKFGEASKAAKALAQELKDNKLSPAEKEKLEKALADLEKQLEKLAAQKKDLENALGEAGVNKDLAEKLAQLSAGELADKLAKMGLDQQTIDKLLQQAAASQSACQACQSLAEAMGKACPNGQPGSSQNGQPSPEGLGQLADSLSDMQDKLEALKARAAMLQQSIDELEGRIAGLGQGQCEGLGDGLGDGEAGPYAEGDASHFGPGTGGPGKGSGARDSDTEGAVKTQKTIVKNADKTGHAIDTWEFKMDQIKGESREKLKDVLQPGKDNAAEAINENQIPTRYHSAMQNYFRGLEKTGDEKK